MTGKRFAALLLSLCLLLCAVPSASAAGDAMPEEELRALLNGVELHPQKTGYPRYDRMLAEILAPYRDADTYTKLRAAYDWTIQNVDFSWAPYAQGWENAYDRFARVHTLAYEDGLQEAIPWDTVNRSYHAMTEHEGVCYDYASLFAVLARYIGIDSYVHTGWFTYEAGFGTGSGEHGWTELCIDGENYIFDPQRDYRMTMNGTVTATYNYFGVPYESAWRYTQDTEANEARDALFLPVAQERVFRPVIRLEATASGTATGGGAYDLGASVTVRADGDAAFVGWFSEDGLLLSTEKTYCFRAEWSRTLIAVFSGEFFVDIPLGAWYRKDASEAGERWIVSGIAPFTFGGEKLLTRAMATTFLVRAANVEHVTAGLESTPDDAWFADAVAWGREHGVVGGKERYVSAEQVTREQYVTMLLRLAELGGRLPEPSELPYPDAAAISDFALDAVRRAQTVGLLNGYDDGTIRPQNFLTRAEGVSMLMRLLRWMESAA